MNTVPLDTVVAYVDGLLHVAQFNDPSRGEINGLLLSADRPVSRVAAAVNTSFVSIEAASRAGAEFLFVYHQSWASIDLHLKPQKEAALRARGVSLYGAHAALACHPELGTGVTLARLLGLERVEASFPIGAAFGGVHGFVRGSFEDFTARASRVLGVPVASWKNSSTFGHVGILTGGAGHTSDVEKARVIGCDTYLTGEGSMYTQLFAREVAMNLILGTHYATEAPAVKALAERASHDLGIPWVFVEEHADVR
ncbi:MAG: Nif3-like dinuclear metal center hexameric protein [bacterium]